MQKQYTKDRVEENQGLRVVSASKRAWVGGLSYILVLKRKKRSFVFKEYLV